MAGPSLDAFGVVARLAGAVGHMEPQVEPAQGIGEDDNGLNGVVDAVVGGLVVEPGRVARGPLHVGDSGAEAGAKGQQGRGEEHEEDAGAHAAPRAKVVDGPVARQQHGEGDDGDGQEGEDGEEGDGEELDVAQLRADVGVEGVEAVDGGDDDHDEQGGDGGPKRRAERMNLCPRRRLRWKMVMLRAAEATKRAMKTDERGVSTEFVGAPPRLAP
ncbi:hypothetical protein VCV18_000452 [Metarhizium anisopliae]